MFRNAFVVCTAASIDDSGEDACCIKEIRCPCKASYSISSKKVRGRSLEAGWYDAGTAQFEKRV